MRLDWRLGNTGSSLVDALEGVRVGGRLSLDALAALDSVLLLLGRELTLDARDAEAGLTDSSGAALAS